MKINKTKMEYLQIELEYSKIKELVEKLNIEIGALCPKCLKNFQEENINNMKIEDDIITLKHRICNVCMRKKKIERVLEKN